MSTVWNYPEPIYKNEDGSVTIDMKKVDPTLDVVIIVPEVKQVKGRGTADADKLTALSDKHKLVLKLLIDMDWEKYTAKQIKTIVENHFKGKGQSVDPNHYNRTISELLRKKLLSTDTATPPHYILDLPKAKECLETGNF